MCGIAGIIGYTKDKAHQPLNSMLDLIQHRGPDDRDTWVTDGCAFGHVRLSIIDLSAAARQPMRCGATGNIITYNGEVYNFLELREELEGKGYIFRTHSDTEVILAAYAVWGRECVHRFIGMFAFAIYDAKTQSVLLVRDRFGIKPLYYTFSDSVFMFASEIKGLLFDDTQRNVNLSAVKDFCRSRVLDASDKTFFNNIYQLRPGCEMWLNIEGEINRPEQKQYYSLVDASSRIKDSLQDATIVDEIRARLSDSVRLRLRSDVPFAALLSGGLDSSSVACMASRNLNEPLHTYSALIDPATPENNLIPIAEKMVGSVPHHNEQTSADFFDELLTLLYHQDEPFADGSMYAHYALMRMIKRDGRSVVLSGQGGDEVFCGYQSYLWAYLASKVRSGNFPEALRFAGISSKANGFSRNALIRNSLRFCMPKQARGWLINNLAKTGGNILSDDANRTVVQRGSGETSGGVFFSEYLAGFDYRTIPAFLHYEDRNSMAFGVEARVPILDHRLVELVAVIAATQPERMFSGGRTKSLLRQCMAPYMKSEIIDQQGKYGFPAPLASWLVQNQEKIRSYLEDFVPSVPFLNYDETIQCFRLFIDQRDAVMLNTTWRALIVTLWYHLFISRTLSAKTTCLN